jgi:hypothetical protein
MCCVQVRKSMARIKVVIGERTRAKQAAEEAAAMRASSSSASTTADVSIKE